METEIMVLIVEDVRDGSPATGKTGIYEGDFPLMVCLGYQINEEVETEWRGEWDYQEYISGNLKLIDGTAAIEKFPEWKQGQSQPRPFFAMVMKNPRIRLEDGSIIWGAECWWKPLDKASPTLEEDKQELEEQKDFLRAIAKLHANESEDKNDSLL